MMNAPIAGLVTAFAAIGLLALGACAAGPSESRAASFSVTRDRVGTDQIAVPTSEPGPDSVGKSTRTAPATDRSADPKRRPTGSDVAASTAPSPTRPSVPSRTVGSTAEAWVVPNPDPRADGTLWMRWSNRTAAVGSGTGFVQVARDTDSAELAVAGFSTASGSTMLARESAGSASVGELSSAVNPVVLMDSGTVYVQQAKALLLEEPPQATGPTAKPAGRRSVPLPSFAPGPASGASQKGIRNTQTSIGALARTRSGAVAAFLSNGLTGAVMDAASGNIVKLPRYGAFGPAITGADGLIRFSAGSPPIPTRRCES